MTDAAVDLTVPPTDGFLREIVVAEFRGDPRPDLVPPRSGDAFGCASSLVVVVAGIVLGAVAIVDDHVWLAVGCWLAGVVLGFVVLDRLGRLDERRVAASSYWGRLGAALAEHLDERERDDLRRDSRPAAEGIVMHMLGATGSAGSVLWADYTDVAVFRDGAVHVVRYRRWNPDAVERQRDEWPSPLRDFDVLWDSRTSGDPHPEVPLPSVGDPGWSEVRALEQYLRGTGVMDDGWFEMFRDERGRFRPSSNPWEPYPNSTFTTRRAGVRGPDVQVNVGRSGHVRVVRERT